MQFKPPLLLVGLMAVPLYACTGSVSSDIEGPGSGNGASGGNGGGPSAGNGGGPSAGAEDRPATFPLRRMTRIEFNNTVRDLLNDTSRPGDGLAGDIDSEGSGFTKGGAVAAVDARQLMEVAEKLAATAVSKFDTLVPCKPVPTDAAKQNECARQFVEKFGRRAFRRPLTSTETAAFTGYYSKTRTDLSATFPDAIRLVTAVILQSPNFLYRWELGPSPARKQGAVVRFNDHEMASRLSYALWATMPDSELFSAADAGQIRTPAQIQAQARRMLKHDKAKDMLADFQTQWMGLGDLLRAQKDARLYPSFNATLAQDMAAETQAFFAHVMGPTGDGKLNTLLTAPFSFVNESLASLYGLTGITGSNLRKVDLDPTRRGGMLTQSAFLTSHGAPGGSHPVKRGAELLERMLCVELPPPPPNLPTVNPPKDNVSTRERFAVHGANACAVGCHALIDPLGFSFEHYDGIGAYRANDGGKPVDAKGTVELGGKVKSFSNAPELTKLLAESDEVKQCMSKQLLRYVLKRKDAAGDEASLAQVASAFADAKFDVRELIVALTTANVFLSRQPSLDEVLQ